MQLNYINKKLYTSTYNPCLKLFMALFTRLDTSFLIYQNNFCIWWLFQFVSLKNKIKKNYLNQIYLNLFISSIFSKGLVRDLVRLNVFFYKLKSFWLRLFVGNIKSTSHLKLTLLRSPFVNKKARLQYGLENYTCLYTLSIKNI